MGGLIKSAFESALSPLGASADFSQEAIPRQAMEDITRHRLLKCRLLIDWIFCIGDWISGLSFGLIAVTARIEMESRQDRGFIIRG